MLQVPRPAEVGPWADGGRDTVYGMQGAVLDLWALASTAKVFRSGESTFGMLASALHRRPAEAVVINASDPQCRSWGQMYPQRVAAAGGGNASAMVPAFCAAHRGAEEPRTCECRAGS